MALARTATGPSPEFREWYRLALSLPAVLHEEEAWEKAHPFADEKEGKSSPYQGLVDRLKDFEDAIFARPVNDWGDVAEIAMITLFWSDKEARPGDDTDDPYSFSLGRDGEVDDEYRNVRSQAHLIQAAAKVGLKMFGGANV